MNISQATSFLTRNLSAGKDFAAGVDKSRAEAERVDKELERIHTDTVDVKKGLDELDKSSALKPPSFKDVSNKDLIIATTSGAVGIFSPVGILSPGVGQGLNMLRICSGEKSNLDKDALGERDGRPARGDQERLRRET